MADCFFDLYSRGHGPPNLPDRGRMGFQPPSVATTENQPLLGGTGGRWFRVLVLESIGICRIPPQTNVKVLVPVWIATWTLTARSLCHRTSCSPPLCWWFASYSVGSAMIHSCVGKRRYGPVGRPGSKRQTGHQAEGAGHYPSNPAQTRK